MKVTDIARVIAPDAEQEIVGIRPGEKLHEQMIGEEDAPSTYEYDEHYKILPVINGWGQDPRRIKSGRLVKADFVYNSGTNDQWMSVDELVDWIGANQHKIGVV